MVVIEMVIFPGGNDGHGTAVQVVVIVKLEELSVELDGASTRRASDPVSPAAALQLAVLPRAPKAPSHVGVVATPLVNTRPEVSASVFSTNVFEAADAPSVQFDPPSVGSAGPPLTSICPGTPPFVMRIPFFVVGPVTVPTEQDPPGMTNPVVGVMVPPPVETVQFPNAAVAGVTVKDRTAIGNVAVLVAVLPA
jgi:hypothetical protein